MEVDHLVEHLVENLVGEQMTHEAYADTEQVVVALCRLIEGECDLLLDLVLVVLLFGTRYRHSDENDGQ